MVTVGFILSGLGDWKKLLEYKSFMFPLIKLLKELSPDVALKIKELGLI